MFIGEQGRGPPIRLRRPRPGRREAGPVLAGTCSGAISWESTSSVAWTIGTSVSPLPGRRKHRLEPDNPASSSSSGEITKRILIVLGAGVKGRGW